jgi:hypothetical protein
MKPSLQKKKPKDGWPSEVLTIGWTAGYPTSTIPWRGVISTIKRDWRFTASCAVVAAAIIYYLWR